ncbi:MAG: hypothetical protein LBP59_08455 [Planctomycetaceae bacterium]|nr:hypothetical protein [Planctomycetaceae bacterium]
MTVYEKNNSHIAVLNCSYFNFRLPSPAYFRTAGFDAFKSMIFKYELFMPKNCKIS